MTGVAARLAEAIHRAGPIPFNRFSAAALDEFFERGGAGRSGGDFVTSPEVGPLFGALVARALDGWWQELGEPDPFVVVEAGAGRGRLAAAVLRAEPACLAALHSVLVERSVHQRAEQRTILSVEPPTDALGPGVAGVDTDTGDEFVVAAPRTGPIVTALADLPAAVPVGVVLANELLDNLPFGVVERCAEGWVEVRVGLHDDGGFAEVLVPASPEVGARFASVDAPVGTRLPDPVGVDAWVAECGALLGRGRLVVVDYVATTAELVERGASGWLRTYRGHGRGGPPLEEPGSQDVTADVWREVLDHAARRAGFVLASDRSQREWLRALGVEELVEEGRRMWEAGASRGDLAAIEGRSRAVEAAALRDPAALGAHRVLEYTK